MPTTDRPKILVVDDLQDNLDLLREVLEDEPYAVFTARDAEAALTLARDEHPDLAILDVEMPSMDGFELCRRIRQELSYWQLPVLFLTAQCTSHDDVARGLNLGACDYVTKPFDRTELRARVRTALRGRCEHTAGVALAKAIARRLRPRELSP